VSQSGRKFVIFSEPIEDRLPFLLHEAVANGVEIVTSDLGGIGEIFDSSVVDSILVRPNLRDLSEKLLKIWGMSFLLFFF
jgi:glycosyltransferase involved in cell wall biosynthesis